MQQIFTFKKLSLIFLAFLLIGCSVSKRALKRGSKEEALGRFREASEIYYAAIIRRPSDNDLKNAFQRSGKKFLDDMSISMSQNFARNEFRRVVYDFGSATSFIERAKNINVDFQVDYSTQRVYENALDKYLEQEYEEGLRLVYSQRFDEAKRKFTEVSKFNPNYKETSFYLNKSANEPLYVAGTNFFNQGRFIDAYNQWSQIVVKDPNYKDVKDRMEQALNERYREGTVFLMNEDFTMAQQALGDVLRVNPSFRDVRTLHIEAVNEPIFRRGNLNLTSGRCRTAYFEFDEIIANTDGNYKNVISLKNEALECAQYPIVVQTVNIPNNRRESEMFEDIIIEQILNANSPFVQVMQIDRRSSARGIVGAINQLLNPTETSNLQEQFPGAKAVLRVDVSNFQKTNGQLRSTNNSALEKRVSRSETGQSTTTYHKVNYQEFNQVNAANISLTYQLISVENGQVLLRQRITDSEIDELNYANYNGNVENLFPIRVLNGQEQIDNVRYSQLQNMFKTNRNITPANILGQNLLNKTGNNIARNIVNFNPDR